MEMFWVTGEASLHSVDVVMSHRQLTKRVEKFSGSLRTASKTPTVIELLEKNIYLL